MNEYLQIVEQNYTLLRPHFVKLIASRYTSLPLSEVEDIYQETFLAIYDNLQHGRVAADTNWKAYIFRIGLNQASNRAKGQKHVPLIDGDAADDTDGKRPSEQYAGMPPLPELIDESTDDPAERERRIEVLNQAINALQDPCRTLLRDFYYNGLSLADIRDEMGFKDTDVVKTKRYKCFDRLKRHVRALLDDND